MNFYLENRRMENISRIFPSTFRKKSFSASKTDRDLHCKVQIKWCGTNGAYKERKNFIQNEME